MIEHGADPSVKTLSGKSCLHIAAQFARFDLIHLLRPHIADINAIDAKKFTAIDYAVEINDKEKRAEICRLLRRIGCKPNYHFAMIGLLTNDF